MSFIKRKDDSIESDNNLLESAENEMKSRMPEECFNNFKRFLVCKLSVDSEVLKSKGYEYFTREYKTEAFTNVKGCKKEYSVFKKCESKFLNRYMDLKNLISEIESKPLPYPEALINPTTDFYKI